MKAKTFRHLDGQSPDSLGFEQLYARDFIKQLGRCSSAELTDLEDPEMDVEWMAQRNHVKSQALADDGTRRPTSYSNGPMAPVKKHMSISGVSGLLQAVRPSMAILGFR